MIEIELLHYVGIPQVINKKTTSNGIIEGSFNQPLSLINPSIEFTLNNIQPMLNDGHINYIKVSDKYYYLMDYEMVHYNHVRVYLHLDVLMTYKSTIGEYKVMLDRSSTNENDNYILDPMLPLSSNIIVTKIDLPGQFSDSEEDGAYVLVTSQNGYTIAT